MITGLLVLGDPGRQGTLFCIFNAEISRTDQVRHTLYIRTWTCLARPGRGVFTANMSSYRGNISTRAGKAYSFR